MTPLATTTTETTTTGGDPGVESFSGAIDTAVVEVQRLLESFASSLPRLAIGLVVLGLFIVAARLVKRLLKPRLADLRSESVARVFSSIVSAVVIVFGVLVFTAVAFPAVDVGTLLGAGGVVALAAGFAFQDILENTMSGLLLLLRQPFEEGDVVEVDGAVGVVEAITVRETRIRRFDKQAMVVPNSQVYKNAIRVQTNREGIRSSVVVGVSYDADLQQAEDLAIEAVSSVEGVLDDPAPEAMYTDFGASSINLDIRYFHGSGQHELRRVQGEVVKAVKAAYDDADIDIPFDIRTLDATGDVAEAFKAIAEDRRAAAATNGSNGSSEGSQREAEEGTVKTRRRVVRLDD